MIRIASNNKSQVAEHFGYCEEFMLLKLKITKLQK